uniref:Uncharacterized protein n=1 Tax=Cynoglossus semilaevis TaxID=244447 RepID=A0A3P8VH28_CYNSE
MNAILLPVFCHFTLCFHPNLIPRSPLMIAASNGQIGMLRLLLRFNADVTLKDTKGWSADDYAVMNGHHPCSLLIIEHGTQRSGGPSHSHQGQNKKKKVSMTGSPYHDVEAGFSLGGPATDKDDAEDISQSESLSRVSKSASDEWPSSEEDEEEELVLSKKKPQKVNLRKMIATKKGEASALLDQSLSGTESDLENDTRIQRIPSLHHQSLHSRNVLQQPVEPAPISFISKAPQKTFNPQEKEDSTGEEEEEEEDDDEEEEDDDDDNEQVGDDEEEDEEEDDQPAQIEKLPDATTTVPVTEVTKDRRRDFLSELGLQKEEEEHSSWDSESHSENPDMLEEKPNMATQKEEEEEGGSAAQQVTKETEHKDDVVEHNADDDTAQREVEKPKWEKLGLLNRLEENNDRKTDLMEELGLGDVDDLEDASDWDSASTTSRRTLPGRKIASPIHDEIPESPDPTNKEPDEDVTPVTPQRSNNSDISSSPQPLPHPQPRARRLVLQKSESEDESDWKHENLGSESTTDKTDNRLKPAADIQTMNKPDSSELSSVARNGQTHREADNGRYKEGHETEDSCEVDPNSQSPSSLMNSDRPEVNDFSDQPSVEETVRDSGDVPWEKRYEKLWVEVEKRDVKSTFKNVAGELKERFGELLKSRCSAEEEQTTAEQNSAEESSSEDEEGEVIVRPTARARRTVLLPIPEQRESGQEESVTESPENSLCEDPMSKEGSTHRPIPGLPYSDHLEECGSPSPHLHADLDFTVQPASDDDGGSVIEEEEFESIPQQQTDSEEKTPDQQMEETSADSSEEAREKAKESSHLVSDQELKEEVERFKPQVGMLTKVCLDLEKEKIQLKREVGEEVTEPLAEVHKASASWDAGKETLKEVGTGKPESSSKCVSGSSGAVHQDLQSAGAQSPNGTTVLSHLPLQQSNSSNNNKKNGLTVEETTKTEVVRGARHGRAPQTNTHVNGDPLSVFDDSTLSDVSDNEGMNEGQGRLPSSGQPKNEKQDEMEMTEDFDELTQSSDTATDEIDSPTSGYRHASILIQKLDSATLDSSTMVKLQNIFHEYERSIQKARSRHGSLADKVCQLELERAELNIVLDEVKDVKSALERNQLELQTEVTNLRFQLKQEQENRRNATMMYNNTKDKLRKIEDQHQLEVQERQKVELTYRNLELEMRTLVANIKQLEEDHSETQRLLAQERSARTLQENLLNGHLRKQQEIEEENKRNVFKSNEALSQLTEATDRERELLRQTATLQEQLTILRADLQSSQANSGLKESQILEENEALKEQLEDARRDLKLNSDALTQTVFSSNNQVTALKSELAMMTTRLENERQSRETLEVEVESTRTRLAGAVNEAERCLAAQASAEKALLREKEDHQRLKDKLSGEAASQRETVSSLSQKLAKTEASANSMENEVHRVSLQLTEKGLLLEVLQREKDQALARVKELETALNAEREQVSRAKARQEASQERLAQNQSEVMLLRQQLEESQNKGDAKERAVTDAQERFSDILSKLRSDSEERVQMVEERNKELSSKAADLRDQIYKLEEERNDRETNLRQLQQELADSLKKLSMSEASLEVNTRYRSDLEEEKTRLLKDMDRLKGKLEDSEDQYLQAEKRFNGLKSSLDEKDKELDTTAQKLQEALSASAASGTTIKQLEDAVQKLEIENARLEAAAKQQSNKIDALQKGAHEAAMLSDFSPGGGVRGHLEDLVTNLQSSKMTLEDQLSREVQRQNALSHTAQDSQALWEDELKSRSKLGLRMAELEKERGELNTQVEIEKKKFKKMAEQKKAVDTRLDQEMNRNTELQKEMYRLRTLLKTAKKKLRDQNSAGGSPMSTMQMDFGRNSQADGGLGRMREKLDDLQMQLQREVSRCGQLEQTNRELKDQLAQKSYSHSSDQLERSKRQLEEEVSDLRRRMETAQMEQGQAEQFRRDVEEKARQEIQRKLDQVNLFLQSQAASQEALDQIRAANESNVRSQLEQKIRELEAALLQTRTTQQESLIQRDSTRTELDRYRELYSEELRLRKSLSAKLDRSNTRLAEANSKLLNERSRSFITSSIANGSLVNPSLDVGALVSPGVTLNRSLGLGVLSPGSEGQNSRVEDYLAKMQSELDKNISKELNTATAELDIATMRLSPVGSASRVDLDPVSRATQQYLEVLKRNNMI